MFEHAFTRTPPSMGSRKFVAVTNEFITSQFSYCPLIWMFHSRRINYKIIKIYEKALKLSYKDRVSTLEYLMTIYKSVTIHEENLQL